MSDTIAAVSTGTQVCAIGIVRMSGGKAIEIADRLFSPVSGRKMADCEDRKLIYGKLCDEQGRLLDICLCTISRAPNSYTGEDTAEFQCHGSPIVLRAVLEAAFSLGARQALPASSQSALFLTAAWIFPARRQSRISSTPKPPRPRATQPVSSAERYRAASTKYTVRSPT